jgi:hypothetical protein
MLRKLAAVAGMVAVSAHVSAAQTCSIASTSPAPLSCSVTSTHSLTVPSLLSLTMSGFTSGTSQTLAAPSAMSDFASSNTIQIPTTGPTFVVKANRAYKVQINAATAAFTGSTYAKPASDVVWSTSSGGTFVGLSTTPADITSGAATTGSTSVGVFYKTTYDFVSDVPGSYNLDVKFTLVAP